MNELLFKCVKCKGFLKKVKDGRFIDSNTDEEGTLDCTYVDTNNPDWDLECEYCGDLDFLKTYYEHCDTKFKGFIVGFKDVVATGYLVVDTEYHFDGREYTKISKQAKDIYKCAIVFFSDNKKRYVPIEDLELIENKEDT